MVSAARPAANPVDPAVPAVRFSEFARILEGLGFARERINLRGPKVVFTHAPTETVVILPPLRANQRVPVEHVLSARVVLPGRGVTTLGRLDTLLRAADGASAAATAAADHRTGNGERRYMRARHRRP